MFEEEENQMGLFEILGEEPWIQESMPKAPEPVQAAPVTTKAAPERVKTPPAPAKTVPARAKAAPSPAKSTPAPAAKPARGKAKAVAASAPVVKKVSGLVPDGDVRLTANIRQDLHLKLKIASAHRRTTIGEIIEELIEEYL